MKLIKVKSENPRDVLSHANAHQNPATGNPKKSSGNYFKTRRLFVLVLLIVSLGAYNVWLLVRCFYDPADSSLNIRQLAVPLGINPFKDKWFDQGNPVDKPQQILRFKKYLDSLSRSADGKEQYQLILANRPGLMDSLILFERMYELQSDRPVDH